MYYMALFPKSYTDGHNYSHIFKMRQLIWKERWKIIQMHRPMCEYSPIFVSFLLQVTTSQRHADPESNIFALVLQLQCLLVNTTWQPLFSLHNKWTGHWLRLDKNSTWNYKYLTYKWNKILLNWTELEWSFSGPHRRKRLVMYLGITGAC